MIDFQEKYNELLNLVENRIHAFIKDNSPEEIYVPFDYMISAGGKRIRPVLCCTAAGAVGGAPRGTVDAAAAVEILHNFTLVHDDIMDESDFRRGRPTIHKKWDEATGILLGDVMVGRAYQLLMSDESRKNNLRMVSEFSKALVEVCEGQVYDMVFNNKKDVTTEDYLLMIEKKTSRLLESATVIGALAGNATDEETEALRAFAYNLGMAFQIQDDLLDITAEQDKLGKKIGLDIVEGKKTYLIIKSLATATEKSDRELLDKFMENNGLPEVYIDDMRKLFRKLGVMDDAIRQTENYFSKAENELKRLKQNDYTQMLNWITNKLRNRNY